jgi:hypothetical protein
MKQALIDATSELQKALTATSASGIALQPEDLESALCEELKIQQPLLGLMEVVQANGRVHEIVRRTGHGKAAYEGASVVGTATQSTYDRPTSTLKNASYWGEVQGLQRAASKRFMDSLLLEQNAGIEAMGDILDFGIKWANATADPYMIDGIDTLVRSNIQDINAVVSLGYLDSIAAAAQPWKETKQDPYVYLMSKGMINKISGLQSLARRQVDKVEFEGAFRMTTYDGVPLLEDPSMKPPAASPATFTATIGAGGALPAATYYYRIASVRPDGECIAAAEDDCISAGPAGNSTANLAWTADANALLYKIYRSSSLGGGAGAETLLATIAAKNRDGTGLYTSNVVAWADDGTAVAPGGAANELPLDTGHESIWLINLNPERGASFLGLLNELGDQLDNYMSYIPLATRKNAYEFMLACFHGLQIKWETVLVRARRVKIA